VEHTKELESFNLSILIYKLALLLTFTYTAHHSQLFGAIFWKPDVCKSNIRCLLAIFLSLLTTEGNIWLFRRCLLQQLVAVCWWCGGSCCVQRVPSFSLQLPSCPKTMSAVVLNQTVKLLT